MHEQESKPYPKSKGLTIVEEEKEKTPRISDESPNELKIDDSEESEKRSLMPKTKSQESGQSSKTHKSLNKMLT